MMQLCAPAIAVLLYSFAISESMTQTQETPETTDVPTLYLYAESDRSVWFDLYLKEEPAAPDRVGAALAAMVSDEDPERVAGYYDGFNKDDGASWSEYWFDALSSHDLLVTGTLELEPLRQVLSELGANTMAVEIYLPEVGLTRARWNDDRVVIEGDNHWNTTSLPLDRPLPALNVSFGFTPIHLARWYLPLLLCCLLLLLYAIFLRRAGLKRPLDEAGFACFACTRGSLYSIVGCWLALTAVSRAWNPLLPLEYGWGPQWAEWPWLAMRDGAVVLLATFATLCARMLVFPVYARFPNATWTRRDFVVQCLWGCALAAIVVMAFGALSHYLVESPARAIAFAVLATILCATVYWQLLFSNGLEIQALEEGEGELRERVDELALAAGIPRINGVYLLHLGRAPILNAFAANNMRVLITDCLLRRLSRREVDAVIAHEVIHIKRRHPDRLRKIMALNLILFCYGAIALYLLGLAVLGVAIELPDWATSSTAILLSTLPGFLVMQFVRMRYARRFEREADDGALALVGDPEAQISSLVKLTRMNHMPLVWGGKWRERLITHPSTLDRVRRIAAQGQVPLERMEELLAGGHAGENSPLEVDCYDSHGIARRRLFNTAFKIGLIRLNRFAFLILPALGATAATCLWSLGVPLPLWCAFPAAMALALGTGIVFQNRAAVRGYRELARQMRAAHGDDIDSQADHFVTFTPNTDAFLYDGFNNWDVGLLRFDAAGLHYRGDGTEFSLPRESIQSIALVPRSNGLIPSLGIHVTWLDSRELEPSRTFLFRAADASSLIAINRESRRLYCALTQWRGGLDVGTSNARALPLPLPGKLDVKGQRVSDVCSGRFVLGSGLKYALCGFAAANAAGLPALTPFAGSAAGVGLATGCAMVLMIAPLWRIGRASRKD